MTEQAVIDAIRRLLDRRGAWHVKTHGSGVGRAGIPDLLCCYRGRFMAIEAKQPGNKPTRLQAHELDRIDHAGGWALVATTAGDVKLVLDAIDTAIDH